jgi:hypothetical protein
MKNPTKDAPVESAELKLAALEKAVMKGEITYCVGKGDFIDWGWCRQETCNKEKSELKLQLEDARDTIRNILAGFNERYDKKGW